MASGVHGQVVEVPQLVVLVAQYVVHHVGLDAVEAQVVFDVLDQRVDVFAHQGVALGIGILGPQDPGGVVGFEVGGGIRLGEADPRCGKHFEASVEQLHRPLGVAAA